MLEHTEFLVKKIKIIHSIHKITWESTKNELMFSICTQQLYQKLLKKNQNQNPPKPTTTKNKSLGFCFLFKHIIHCANSIISLPQIFHLTITSNFSPNTISTMRNTGVWIINQMLSRNPLINMAFSTKLKAEFSPNVSGIAQASIEVFL